MKPSWKLTAAAITLVVVAAAVLVWDADPVITGELALRRAIWGPDATIAYPSRLFANAKSAHAKLPSGDRLDIPSLGIDVEIVRAKSADAGLPYGIWLDPAGSTPGSGEPVVLAGHRIDTGQRLQRA